MYVSLYLTSFTQHLLKEIPELMLTLRLENFKVVPVLIEVKCTRVRSRRAHSKIGTNASMHIGRSRVSYATAHSR